MPIDLERFQQLANTLVNLGVKQNESIDSSHPFDARNIHQKISDVSLGLFDDGHFSQATFEAFKFIDKEVERLSELNETGRSLMLKAFKEDNPPLALNALETTSQKNEQEGYKFIFTGAIVGIRNPRGHEFGKVDSIEECLDHLSLASQLLRVLDDRVIESTAG